jgi:HPt (histidine-containing phosphotransfer) domain-containing protein
MATDDSVITFDLDAARRNFDGDESLIRDIGQIFVEDVPLLVDRLEQLRTQLDRDALQEVELLEEAKRVAHSLKGLAGTFGAQPLGSMLAEIEREPRLLTAADGETRLRDLERVARETVDELAKSLHWAH